MPVLGGEPASPAVPTPRLAAGIPAPHSVRYPAAPARLPPRPPGAGRAAPPARHSTAPHRTAPHRTHGHSRRAAASPARTEGPGRRRSGDITRGSSASAALPLPFPGGASGLHLRQTLSDALPARRARRTARVAAALAPRLPCPRTARGRCYGPYAAVPALRARRSLRAGGQPQGRRSLRGAARRAGPLRGRAGLRARVCVGHEERREGGTRGAVLGAVGGGAGLECSVRGF